MTKKPSPLNEVITDACRRTFRAGKAAGIHTPNPGFFGAAFAEHFPKGTFFGANVQGTPCLRMTEEIGRIELRPGKVVDLSDLDTSTPVYESLFAEALKAAAQEVFPHHKVRDHKLYFNAVTAFLVESVAA